jgi:hypothetical protein
MFAKVAEERSFAAAARDWNSSHPGNFFAIVPKATGCTPGQA